MANQHIELKGIRVHNLKNIDISIPVGKLILVTGVSGSGKSSLAFDTLYAEGQRRYVESLSSYARQFLGRLNKPECDYIKGIPPAIAIEQKVNTSNPRSTVGTSTEIYDYIKLLFARCGVTYSPISGQEVKRNTVSDVVDYILLHKNETVIILGKPKDLHTLAQLRIYFNQGFVRILRNDEFLRIDDLIEQEKDLDENDDLFLVFNRIKVDEDKDTISRISESIELAFYEGEGSCIIDVKGQKRSFSSSFALDGITFIPPTVNMFSFNSPLGACPKCEGYGKILGIDEDLVIPNKSLSVYEDAVMCWRGEKMSEAKRELIKNAHKVDFPIHTPYYQLTQNEKNLLWKGCKYFYGINDFFAYLEEKKYKIQNRVMIARYTGKTICPACNGTRLQESASYVKISGKSVPELVNMSIETLYNFFNNLNLSTYQKELSDRILPDIQNRLGFLLDVGLGYLSLNRLSSTLSGGESQRINLATSLGSALVGSLYILDEPSIGLHSRDTERLLKVLKRLRDLGNTVIIVEHDEDIILAADELIDIGPKAGMLGGELVFQGSIKELKKAETLTADYIYGRRKIEVPTTRRIWTKSIGISGITENNLKNITVEIPLEVITIITGVSGSGKSTLTNNILVPALKSVFDQSGGKTTGYSSIYGDLSAITSVEFIDQNPIGKSSRSNPVTYIKAWDDIRKLFADTQRSKFQGYKPSHFSFNVAGGRCEECQGEGIIKVEMQFMADVYLQCEHCKGHRFQDEVLEVKYRDKNIYDILEMTVNMALKFFSAENNIYERSIVDKLQKLADVGLGYIKLGQSSSTLSGGESQRVKLAYFLSKGHIAPTLFVFDEPTTGLHFHDINKLMSSLYALIDFGHSVLIVEHNMDVIKCADHIIDLGPDGGDAGGEIVFAGTPENLLKCKKSHTAKFLKL